MDPIQIHDLTYVDRSLFRPVGALIADLAVAALLMLAIAANAQDDRTAQPDTQSVTAVAPARSISDLDWNEHEDLRVGGYMGLPGVY